MGKELPLLSALQTWRAQFSFTSGRKPEMTLVRMCHSAEVSWIKSETIQSEY